MSETLAGTEAKAVGIVTEHTSRWSRGPDRPSLLFFPSVRFQTADGRTVEFQNGIGTNAPLGWGTRSPSSTTRPVRRRRRWP